MATASPSSGMAVAVSGGPQQAREHDFHKDCTYRARVGTDVMVMASARVPAIPWRREWWYRTAAASSRVAAGLDDQIPFAAEWR